MSEATIYKRSYWHIVAPVAALGLMLVLYFVLKASWNVAASREGAFLLDNFPMIALTLAGVSTILGLLYVQRERQRMQQALDATDRRNQILSQYITDLSTGKQEIETPEGEESLLVAIRLLHARMLELAAEQSERKWSLEGMAFFSDILRRHHDLDVLANEFIRKLAQYVGAAQGAMFIIRQESVDELRISGAYVSDDMPQLTQDLLRGEGLVGQVIQEAKPLYLEHAPAGYVRIASGLGQAASANLFLAPMVVENRVEGVIELASFKLIGERERAFVTELANKVGVTVFNLKTAARTNEMLQEARELTDALQAGEAAMRIRDRAIAAGSAAAVITDRIHLQQPIIYVNPAFEAITGYTATEVMGRPLDFLFDTDFEQEAVHHLRQAQQNGVECRVLLQAARKDGATFWNELSLSPVLDDEGRQTHFVWLFNDVTQRIEIENQVRQMNENLEAMVRERTESLSSALEELRSAQTRVVQSEKMASLGQLVAGVAHEINTPLAAIKAAAENMTEFLPRAIDELPQLMGALELEQRRLFLDLIHVTMTANDSLSTRDERRLRKEFEEVLQEAGAPDAREIAKKLVTNGLRTDVLRFLPLLLMDNSKEAMQTAYYIGQMRTNLDVIHQAANKTRKTVYALKRYTHFQQEEIAEKVDIRDNLEVILTLYHNQLKHGVEVLRLYEDNVPNILGYSDELGQVWTNIIHNAAQAMQFQGMLEVALRHENGQVIVKISDNGPGIPAEILPRIFEPFFTTKPQGEGTGLGLDICRKIIEKHEGHIEVASQPGETSFTIMLPVEAPSLVKQREERGAQVSGSGEQ